MGHAEYRSVRALGRGLPPDAAALRRDQPAVPERVEAGSGYRWYDVAQLARLHRLLALRDLGFSLQQVAELLTDEPSVEQLRGMLRLRQSQTEATVEQERARLRRIEAHLRALERTNRVTTQDVGIKHTQPLRIVEMTAIAPGPGPGTVGRSSGGSAGRC